jgi:hypothetical protein
MSLHFPKPGLCLLAGAALAAGTLQAAAPDSAAAQFQRLQAQLHQSHQAHDHAGYLAAAQQLAQLLNGSPDALLELARARLESGDTEGARHELQRYAAMGQGADLLQVSQEFAPLLAGAAGAPLQQALAANREPVAGGERVLALADGALLAEDVDWSPATAEFFISSVREHKLVAVKADGRSRDFAVAPDGWPLVALKVDAARGRVWTTEVALRELSFSPSTDWGKSALLCYELRSGRLLQRIDGPQDSNLGDLVLTRQGAVIVSDGDGGGVYRLAPGAHALERLDSGEFISPQTPVLHPDGRHLLVPDYLRGIAVLDLQTRALQWLPMDGRYALQGIDGLYLAHGRLVAVQNGTVPVRIAAFTLAGLEHLRSMTLLERGTPQLDPTHGLVLGGFFYYLANSGWDALDEHGAVKPGVQPSGARLMRVALARLRP